MGESPHQWQWKWQKHSLLTLSTNIQQLSDKKTQRLAKCKQRSRLVWENKLYLSLLTNKYLPNKCRKCLRSMETYGLTSKGLAGRFAFEEWVKRLWLLQSKTKRQHLSQRQHNTDQSTNTITTPLTSWETTVYIPTPTGIIPFEMNTSHEWATASS